MPHTHKGVLDHLDRIDKLLAKVDLMETLDPQRRRENMNLIRNARLEVQAAILKVDRADNLSRKP